ncbi:unnamed protein product [Arabidopsis arenosa]|uniref:Uncharacterized protein n=1 Tax=Arabidopsis arenosa TaxID=38785 RepID=A0A8S2ACL1_ARAAE|nr:unnamed protein product [Arabidopsis arenosa]
MVVLKGGLSSGYKNRMTEKGSSDETYTMESIALIQASGTGGENNELNAVSAFNEIVPDTVVFDDFERFPPTATTVSSALLLGICGLPDTIFCVKVGGDFIKLVPGRVSTEVDARLAYDTNGIIRKGIEAARLLESEGIQTHMTFVYRILRFCKTLDQSSSGNQEPIQRAAALAENLLCLLLFILGTKPIWYWYINIAQTAVQKQPTDDPFECASEFLPEEGSNITWYTPHSGVADKNKCGDGNTVVDASLVEQALCGEALSTLLHVVSWRIGSWPNKYPLFVSVYSICLSTSCCNHGVESTTSGYALFVFGWRMGTKEASVYIDKDLASNKSSNAQSPCRNLLCILAISPVSLALTYFGTLLLSICLSYLDAVELTERQSSSGNQGPRQRAKTLIPIFKEIIEVRIGERKAVVLLGLLSPWQNQSNCHGTCGERELYLRRISLSKFHTADEVWTARTMAELSSGCLPGSRADGDSNQLPTIALVASYDTFGAAPALLVGSDSNGSGVVLLLEVARLLSALSSNPKTRGSCNLLFALTATKLDLNPSCIFCLVHLQTCWYSSLSIISSAVAEEP